MKPVLQSIILLLTFALLIQNTCPMGAAGKSTLAAACAGCSLKHQIVVAAPDKDVLTSDPSAVHFPLYVFSVPKCVHTFRLEPTTLARTFLVNSYEDALPHELLRPPRT